MRDMPYEIRDAIHATIRFDEAERSVIDSQPVQRLRHIRQLGSAYLLYPGATYSRFEHSLGTMELASRVFDTVTRPDPDQPVGVRRLLAKHRPEFPRWRHAVRMAALCHDIGHLPFSHSAERDVLPAGYSHERLTRELIHSKWMMPCWRQLGLSAEMVAKLSIGEKFYLAGSFSPWEQVLTSIITGDAFGVDRMDYLLRDSYHIGVAYGTIDHHRLIDTIRILPVRQGFQLGIREGGLHSAEALMLARYLMFEQVYCHHVAQIYDAHLVDFMKAWLPGGVYDVRLRAHLQLTDNELLAAMRDAYLNGGPGRDSAKAILERRHLKLLFEPTPVEKARDPLICVRLYQALVKSIPAHQIRYRPGSGKTDTTPDFPVLLRDGSVEFSKAISGVLSQMPPLTADYIFVARESYARANRCLKRYRAALRQIPASLSIPSGRGR